MSNNSDSKPKKKERKLTEAEIKRKANFKAKEAALLEKGYKRKDLTVSIAKANFVGVLLTVPFVGRSDALERIFSEILYLSGCCFCELYSACSYSRTDPRFFLVKRSRKRDERYPVRFYQGTADTVLCLSLSAVKKDIYHRFIDADDDPRDPSGNRIDLRGTAFTAYYFTSSDNGRSRRYSYHFDAPALSDKGKGCRPFGSSDRLWFGSI